MAFTPPAVPAPPPGLGPWMRSIEKWIKTQDRQAGSSARIAITEQDLAINSVSFSAIQPGAVATQPPAVYPRAAIVAATTVTDYDSYDQRVTSENNGTFFEHAPPQDGVTPAFAGLRQNVQTQISDGSLYSDSGSYVTMQSEREIGTSYSALYLNKMNASIGVTQSDFGDLLGIGSVDGAHHLSFSNDVNDEQYDGAGAFLAAGQVELRLVSPTGFGADAPSAVLKYPMSGVPGNPADTVNYGFFLRQSPIGPTEYGAKVEEVSMRATGTITDYGAGGVTTRDGYYAEFIGQAAGYATVDATYGVDLKLNGTTAISVRSTGVDITGTLTNNGSPISGGGGAAAPTGAMMLWPTATPPAGWDVCQGQSVLRTGTYAALYAVIGTTYGSVDSTHFNLPDMGGRTAVGYASGDANFGTLATAVGAATVAGAAHTHTSAAHTHTSAAHTHALSDNGQAAAQFAAAGQILQRRVASSFTATVQSTSATAVPQSGSTASAANGIGLVGATDSATPGATGSTTPGATGSTSPAATSVIQPSLTLNYIIKL